MRDRYDEEEQEKNKEKEDFLNEFLETIKERLFLKKTLMLDFSNFEVFDSPDIEADKYMTSIQKIENTSEKFDFIIGNLPLGLPSEEFIDSVKEMKIKIKKNWIYLLKSLFLLEENRHGKGYGLYLVEPSFLRDKKFKELLREKGFFINAVFRTPENFFDETTIRPLLVLISKRETKKLFVCEFKLNVKRYSSGVIIETMSFESVLGRFISGNFNKKEFPNTLELGVWVDSSFEDFEKYKIKKQLSKLSTQYNEFKEHKISDISQEIILSNKLKKIENSVYIPKIGTSLVINNLDNAKLKHQNYIQIILKKEIIKSEYLSLFFCSEIGKLILKTLLTGSIIPHINKSSIGECLIPIPSIKIQESMIRTSNKLKSLKNELKEFEDELALNPKNSNKIQENLDNILKSLDMLNDSDKVLSLIREFEHATLEFKSTLRKPIEKQVPEKVIEKASLKNIAGFLNAQGGILLIGVDDEGNILGLENDGFSSDDDLLKHLSNLIKRDFEPSFYDLIKYKIVRVDNKKVLMIECGKSDKPVFIGKEEEFYVRRSPTIDKLIGKHQHDYIQSHFYKKGDNK